MLNIAKGNMYPWCNFTWNPIKGKCPHECTYCYMNRFPQGSLHLDKKCLKDNLGEDNTIFVGSSTDMWAEAVLIEDLTDVIFHCLKFPENTYLFQSKNPKRFIEVYNFAPPKIIYGTTLETNRDTSEISKAPSPEERGTWISLLWPVMISIEPILDFDLVTFVEQLKYIEPSFVSIGADSKNHHLPEPPAEKIKELIAELQKFTEVKIKPNLTRLMG